MNEKTRNNAIIVLLIAGLALLLIDPSGIYRGLATLQQVASIVFYIAATIYIVRKW